MQLSSHSFSIRIFIYFDNTLSVYTLHFHWNSIISLWEKRFEYGYNLFFAFLDERRNIEIACWMWKQEEQNVISQWQQSLCILYWVIGNYARVLVWKSVCLIMNNMRIHIETIFMQCKRAVRKPQSLTKCNLFGVWILTPTRSRIFWTNVLTLDI